MPGDPGALALSDRRPAGFVAPRWDAPGTRLALRLLVVAGVIAIAVVLAMPASAPNAETLAPALPAIPPHGSPAPASLGHRPQFDSAGSTALVVPLVNQSMWYLLEGSSVGQFDGSASVTSTAALSVNLSIPSTLYSIALVLSAVSDVGDFYQAAAIHDWPGCPTGWQVATQVWTAAGSPGPVECNSTIALVPSDSVVMNVSLAAPSSVCMGVADLSLGRSEVTCAPPPGSATTGFVPTPTPSASGYTTGPSTEVMANASSTCPELADAPRVDYTLGAFPSVSALVPWAYEWGGANGATTCISFTGTTHVFAGGDAVAEYVQPLAGTAQSGTHIELVQNLSPLEPWAGVRFGTDQVPIEFLQLTTSATAAAVGSSVTLRVNATGGVGPYRAVFTLNGTALALGPSTIAFAFHGAGTYRFRAYVVDALDTMVGPSPAVNVTVPQILTVWNVTASPSRGGTDVGTVTQFVAGVSGGEAPMHYAWSGLPPGCPPPDRAVAVCTPTLPGPSWVNVTVEDALGWTATGPGFLFVVVDPPLVHLTAVPTVVDVNGTLALEVEVLSGSAPLTFAWAGLPEGCRGTDAPTLSCHPTVAGNYSVTVSASDRFGGHVASLPVSVEVAPALRASVTSDLPVVDVGAPLVLSANASGGAGGLAYAWVGLPSDCPSMSQPTVTCIPSGAGTIAAAVFVSDRTGLTSGSPSLVIPVYAALSAHVTMDPAFPSAGGSVRLFAGVVGGAPGPHFSWSGLPPGCGSENVAVLACTPSTSGAFSVRLEVTDPGGGSAVAFLRVAVAANPALAFLGSPGGGYFLVSLAIAGAAIVAALVVRWRRFGPSTGSRTVASRIRSFGRGTTGAPTPYRRSPDGRSGPSRSRP